MGGCLLGYTGLGLQLGGHLLGCTFWGQIGGVSLGCTGLGVQLGGHLLG